MERILHAKEALPVHNNDDWMVAVCLPAPMSSMSSMSAFLSEGVEGNRPSAFHPVSERVLQSVKGILLGHRAAATQWLRHVSATAISACSSRFRGLFLFRNRRLRMLVFIVSLHRIKVALSALRVFDEFCSIAAFEFNPESRATAKTMARHTPNNCFIFFLFKVR